MYVLMQRIYGFLESIWNLLCNVWELVQGFLRYCWRLVDAIPAYFASMPAWVLPLALCCFSVGFTFLVIGRR